MPRKPTPTLQRVRTQAMNRMRDAQEVRLSAELTTVFKRTAKRVKGSYPKWTQAMVEHEAMLAVVLKASLPRVAMAAAQIARESYALPLAEGLGMVRYLPTQQELDALVSKLAKQRAVAVSGEIGKHTRTVISDLVSNSLEAGMAPAEIAKALEERIVGMSESRALTIARTETAIATQNGQFQEMQATSEALGMPLLKTWVATSDERTRETHSEASGQQVAMDEPFKVGDAELMFPSDPDGPPEEVINCRCAIVFDPA